MRGERKNERTVGARVPWNKSKRRQERQGAKRVDEIVAESGELIVGLRVACAGGNLLSLLC